MRWSGSGDWTQTSTLDTEATSAAMALRPEAAAGSVLVDRVACTHLVQLDVDERGATFQGEDGIGATSFGG